MDQGTAKVSPSQKKRKWVNYYAKVKKKNALNRTWTNIYIHIYKIYRLPLSLKGKI